MHTKPSPIDVVEGADGVGKSTALLWLGAYHALQLDTHAFNVVDFDRAHHCLPTLEEIGSARVLIIGEPTFSKPTGAFIREQFLPGHVTLSVPEQAEAYAADRQYLYETLVRPFLEKHAPETAYVVSSRNVLSSLAYQSPHWPGAKTLEEGVRAVLGIKGNQAEFRDAPRNAFVLDLDAQTARARLQGRGHEAFDVFEHDLSLQTQIRDLYHHPALRAPFLERGTRFHTVDARRSPQQIRADLAQILIAS